MAWQRLLNVMNRVSDLRSATAVLSWDQETHMPKGAVAARSEQMATLSGLEYELATNQEARAAIAEYTSYESELTSRQRLIAENFMKDFNRLSRLPESLVVEQSRVASLAQDTWQTARAADDFTIFQPLLERTVQLKREEAKLISEKGSVYDALLDIYEPGLTAESLVPVFDRLRAATVELLAEITPRQHNVSDDVLYRFYPKDQQLALAQTMIDTLGFSSKYGRVDLSAHPFCTHFSMTDVRLTTRIRENDLRSCLFGLIHEAGHGMYEQGVPSDLARTPSGQGASMGIHESQSLFWENVIARSEAFWAWAFPIVKNTFPDQLHDQTEESFFRAINRMKPSLNRVESDELTYNLHIINRFEIERDLIEGNMEVKDIPAVWNQKMKTSLGVVPESDAEGCLQDVHWSFGGFGYFPSYTLGKLYAAMEWQALRKEISNVDDLVANGKFAPILAWLRTNIHSYGKTESPDQIIKRITGRALAETDFISYVGTKARRVYGF